MGGASSRESERSFVDSIRTSVEDEMARRMMLQREVQMAVNIAKARDTIWVFGSAWSVLTTAVLGARAAGKTVPSAAGIPVVVGALVLGNMADMAYGNKLARVNKEAEYILENERGRFVPFRQAPFSKFYTDDERASLYEPATAVGELFPNTLWARRRMLPGPTKEDKP
jgi:Uncharacterised conserved protein (DUF2368)